MRSSIGGYVDNIVFNFLLRYLYASNPLLTEPINHPSLPPPLALCSLTNVSTIFLWIFSRFLDDTRTTISLSLYLVNAIKSLFPFLTYLSAYSQISSLSQLMQ